MTPHIGNVYVRYSPDQKNWSSWQLLSVAKLQDQDKSLAHHFEGQLNIPNRQLANYRKLLNIYVKQDVPWKSDEEAAVRWILKQQPDFFSKNIPFMGYIEFLYERDFYKNQRIRTLKAEVFSSINGIHYPSKSVTYFKERSNKPWNFKAK